MVCHALKAGMKCNQSDWKLFDSLRVKTREYWAICNLWLECTASYWSTLRMPLVGTGLDMVMRPHYHDDLLHI